MFSAPVNQEFIKKEVAETSETTTSESAGQAGTEDKLEGKPEEKQPDAAAAAVQGDKVSKVKAGAKSAAKAAPKAKPKGQASAKAKKKTKQTDKKDSKSAAKKTVKVATKSSKAGSGTVSGSQGVKQEL